MKCPHCLVTFHASWVATSLGSDRDGDWGIKVTGCPACRRMIVFLGASLFPGAQFSRPIPAESVHFDLMVRPKAPSRAPLPAEVPEKYAEDYTEACLVFADSAKASAALSRRCLQKLFRDHVQVKATNLYNEIQQVLDSGKLPSDLAEAIDAIRVVGNFAAHPIKSTNTGEIIDVEPGEAEWLLDTLETLFDFYFVRTEALKKKRDALNAKLAEAGKPSLK